MPKPSDNPTDEAAESAGGESRPEGEGAAEGSAKAAPSTLPGLDALTAGFPSFSFDLPPIPGSAPAADTRTDATPAGGVPAPGGDATPAGGLPAFGGLPPLFGEGSAMGVPSAAPPTDYGSTTPPAEPGGASAPAGSDATPAHLAMGAPFDIGAPPSSPSAAASGGDATPAHLALPSFDFSLPPLPGVDTPAGGAPDGAAGATAQAGGDVPAHLQLPSFPQFELPPVPGQEPTPPPGATPPHLAASEGAAVPPPRPPPPPRRRSRPAASPTPSDALPAFELPALAPEPKKKEVTLLASEEAAELAHVPKHRRPVVPFLLLGAVVAAGAVAFVEREPLVAMLASKDQKPAVVETKEDKALALYASGQDAYAKSKLDEAAKSFESAIEINPSFAKAHRALAIARAKQNKAAEAVEHYKLYLDLDPKASDAEQVRKIISDYEKAKAASNGAGKAAEPAPAPTKKKRR